MSWEDLASILKIGQQNLGVANPLLQNGDFFTPTGDAVSDIVSSTTPGIGTPELSGWDKFRQNFFGGKNTDGSTSMGWGTGLFGLAKGGMDTWLALKQLGLAQDSFNFQKDAWTKQYNNQRTLTNSALSDRQNARLSADPSGYESVESYMNKYGV